MYYVHLQVGSPQHMHFVVGPNPRTSLERIMKQGQTDIQSPYIRPL